MRRKKLRKFCYFKDECKLPTCKKCYYFLENPTIPQWLIDAMKRKVSNENIS